VAVSCRIDGRVPEPCGRINSHGRVIEPCRINGRVAVQSAVLPRLAFISEFESPIILINASSTPSGVTLGQLTAV
jgi:hypothetical protein